MKYQNSQFSVAMPATVKRWPFDAIQAPRKDITRCAECGTIAPRGRTHFTLDTRDRPRKRVCFGLRDA